MLCTELATCGDYPPNTLIVMNETNDRTLLTQPHIWHRQQCHAQRLKQPWIADVGHACRINGPSKVRTQSRQALAHLGDIHRLKCSPLAHAPSQRLDFVMEVQPVQTGDMDLGINPCRRKQPLAKTRIKIL